MEIKNEKNKISIYQDNNEIGKITFFEENNYLVVDHTFVDPAYRGQNYARVLVDEVVKLARNEGKMIIPVCPYVDKVLARDEKYSDVYKIDHDYGVECKL